MFVKIKINLMYTFLILFCYYNAVHSEQIESSKQLDLNKNNYNSLVENYTETMLENVKSRFDASRDVQIYYYDCGDLTNRRNYNSSAGTKIYVDGSLLKTTSFSRNKPTRVLIHGWLADRSSPFFDRIVEGYLGDSCISRLTNDFNLILVDWSAGSQANYNTAKSCVPETGKYVAQFLDNLACNFQIDLDDVSLIGFSMGAHISGIAGKNVKHGKIGVIVGLDPAGRQFWNEIPEKKLTPNDAAYVEVIHTNAGNEIDSPRRWGIDQPLGHADFYPNGGVYQGCFGSCAHYRAIRYFAESLTPHTAGFLAKDCDSYQLLVKERECVTKTGQIAQMGGEPSMRHQRGIYYLRTRFISPYGRGIYGFLYTNDIRELNKKILPKLS